MKYSLKPIGFIQSSIKDRADAPKQGYKGAPDAWVEMNKEFVEGLDGINVGQEIILITWLHQSQRNVLKVHPQSNPENPLKGVFATRSPDRPNPLGLHRVRVLEIAGNRIKMGPLEAIDQTPVVDIKPVLSGSHDY